MSHKCKIQLFYCNMPTSLNQLASVWRCPDCGKLTVHPKVPWPTDTIADLYCLIEWGSYRRAELEQRLRRVKNENVLLILAILTMLIVLAQAWRCQ